jgi:hypothetical protein
LRIIRTAVTEIDISEGSFTVSMYFEACWEPAQGQV